VVATHPRRLRRFCRFVTWKQEHLTPLPDPKKTPIQTQDQNAEPLPEYEGNSFLYGCNAPASELLPETYTIHLTSNHTLTKHFTTISRNLNSSILYINDTLWTDRIIYTASSITPSLLHNIRSDPNVSYVFCSRNPEVPYKAPLPDEDPEFPRARGEFDVYLFPGHSMEEHSRVVGEDMEKYDLHFWLFDKERIAYWAKGIDENLLERIRADPGVEFLEASSEVYLIE
jgi:hypothetical protein